MQPSAEAQRPKGALLNTVVSLVVGAVLGVAVSKIFDDDASLLFASVSVAAVLLAGVLCFHVFEHGRAQGSGLDALSAEIARVRNQIGEPADLTFERFDQSTGAYYHRLERIAGGLKPGDQVLVMTHHTRRVDDNAARNEAHDVARLAYLETLLKKASEGVVYRRIICFEPTGEDVEVQLHFLRNHTREHCASMLALGKLMPTTVSVKKAPALLMADILSLQGFEWAEDGNKG